MPNTIYALRCRENGRSYIGRTGSSLQERFKKHVYKLNHNIHDSKLMQSDYNKYGKSSFEMLPIFETDDYEYAKRLEKIVMLTLSSNGKANGYNRQDPAFIGKTEQCLEKAKNDAENFLKVRISNAVSHDASELSEKSGFTIEQIQEWRENPLSIRAVDLIRLEQVTGVMT